MYLRIEPLPRGSGFEFVDDVVGGAIPGQFIPAVEKGVRQVMNEGAIAGFALQDLRVSVYDGKHHAVDSKEVAFVAAGRKAFITAIREAGPIVLEPVVRVAISSPASAIGDVTSDLATRRARINGQDTLPGGRAEISALVPLAELQDYLSRLKSLTGGEGTLHDGPEALRSGAGPPAAGAHRGLQAARGSRLITRTCRGPSHTDRTGRTRNES